MVWSTAITLLATALLILLPAQPSQGSRGWRKRRDQTSVAGDMDQLPQLHVVRRELHLDEENCDCLPQTSHDQLPEIFELINRSLLRIGNITNKVYAMQKVKPKQLTELQMLSVPVNGTIGPNEIVILQNRLHDLWISLGDLAPHVRKHVSYFLSDLYCQARIFVGYLRDSLKHLYPHLTPDGQIREGGESESRNIIFIANHVHKVLDVLKLAQYFHD